MGRSRVSAPGHGHPVDPAKDRIQTVTSSCMRAIVCFPGILVRRQCPIEEIRPGVEIYWPSRDRSLNLRRFLTLMIVCANRGRPCGSRAVGPGKWERAPRELGAQSPFRRGPLAAEGPGGELEGAADGGQRIGDGAVLEAAVHLAVLAAPVLPALPVGPVGGVPEGVPVVRGSRPLRSSSRGPSSPSGCS